MSICLFFYSPSEVEKKTALVINRYGLLSRKISNNIKNENMLLTFTFLEYHSI